MLTFSFIAIIYIIIIDSNQEEMLNHLENLKIQYLT